MLQTGTFDAEQRARAALASSPIFAIRDIRVDQSGTGHLVLTGRVDSFYHKQVAQEVVRAVVRGQQIVNSIDVVD